MTTYKQIDDDTIQFSTINEDGSITTGPIVNGRTRTRQVQGVLETYSPYDELMATNPTIEPVVVIVPDYTELRKAAYPSITDFADAYVKAGSGDSTDMDAYVAKCLAVKLQYPKD